MELSPLGSNGNGAGVQHSASETQAFSIGDSVYVRGQGPARLIVLGDAVGPTEALWTVEYPNGKTEDLPPSAMQAHLRSAKGTNSGPSSLRSQRQTSDAGATAASPAGPERQRLELLRPGANSPSRQLRLPNAIFNLVCTMCGGGMLSLPFAFRSCGLILGVVILVVGGLASAFSIELLVACSRADGSDNYEQVMSNALGPWARKVCGFLVFMLTFLVSVGILVLIADLVSPVLTWCCFEVTPLYRTLLMVAIMTVVTPLCLTSSQAGLRKLSVFGLFAFIFVAAGVAIVALPQVGAKHNIWTFDAKGQSSVAEFDPVIHWYPRDFGSVIFAIPIFALSYMAHFNVLGGQAELRLPTRERASMVTFGTVISCTVFYIFFGITGYLFSGDLTCGNTLLNFDGKSGLLAATRLGLAICLANNLPLLVLPCRSALHRLTAGAPEAAECRNRTESQSTESAIHAQAQLLEAQQRQQEVHVYQRGLEEAGTFDKFQPKIANSVVPEISRNLRILYTLGLVAGVTFLACALPSILVVFSFAGATICFPIAFIFPAAAWIWARGEGASPLKRFAAWLLLVSASFLMVACTVMSVVKFSDNPCPTDF